MSTFNHVIPNKKNVYTRYFIAVITTVLFSFLVINPWLVSSGLAAYEAGLVFFILSYVVFGILNLALVGGRRYTHNKALRMEFIDLYCQYETVFKDKKFYSGLFKKACIHGGEARFKHNDFALREIIDEMRETLGLADVRKLTAPAQSARVQRVHRKSSEAKQTKTAPESSDGSAIQKIEALKRLLDAGAITDSEYQGKKAQLLEQI